jgi:hypothetical protein
MTRKKDGSFLNTIAPKTKNKTKQNQASYTQKRKIKAYTKVTQ